MAGNRHNAGDDWHADTPRGCQVAEAVERLVVEKQLAYEVRDTIVYFMLEVLHIFIKGGCLVVPFGVASANQVELRLALFDEFSQIAGIAEVIFWGDVGADVAAQDHQVHNLVLFEFYECVDHILFG